MRAMHYFLKRRHMMPVFCAAALGALAIPALAADNYPSKPITIVVGYPPGGSTDLVGRLVATELSDRLKQPVVIENLGGAGGAIGAHAGLGAGGLLGLDVDVAGGIVAHQHHGQARRDLVLGLQPAGRRADALAQPRG